MEPGGDTRLARR